MRIPFDSLTLMAVVEEMRPALVGGRIQRVAQPDPLDLILTVRNHGANAMAVFSANAAHARAHLTVIKRPNPAEAPAFCMMCRKHLEGGIITSVDQVDFDRVLEIRIETAGREIRLIAELMGKHSNLILVAESGAILDAIKRITRKQSRFREMLPGLAYSPPPPQAERKSPFEARDEDLEAVTHAMPADSEAIAARIAVKFSGISPFLGMELALRAQETSISRGWEEIFGGAAAGKWMPVLVRDERGRSVGAYPFPTVQAPAKDQHERSDICTALDHYYGSALPTAALDATVQEVARDIERALRAKRSKQASLSRSLEEAGRSEEYRKMGELLLANLHRVEVEAESVTVEDYANSAVQTRAIPLDPAKSPQENAEAFFRRYRKSREAAKHHHAMHEQGEHDISRLVQAAESVRDVNDLEEVKALRGELTEEGLLRDDSARPAQERKRDQFQGKKIRAFTTPEGWELLWGENSEANDFLTTRIAGPNDLWLHVRATPSAHVVIRTRNEPYRVPLNVIRRAAIVAAQHSAAKHSATVPVDYTLKKHVRRPRGAAPGAAHYKNEKTIHVSPKDG